MKVSARCQRHEKISAVIKRMALTSEFAHIGIAVVEDYDGRVIGTVTDGDIRRSLALDIDPNETIDKIACFTPHLFSCTLSLSAIRNQVEANILSSKEKKKLGWVNKIIIVDNDNKLVDIVDYFEILRSLSLDTSCSCVVGLGYVGLTLAVSLASFGNRVIGIDLNKQVCESLSLGNSHIYEPGINQLLSASLQQKLIRFDQSITSSEASVYILCVGTPILDDLSPNLDALVSSVSSVAKVLKKFDLVCLRSTVPVGTTRDIVIPLLEKISSLQAGVDFYVSFAPERTVEGDALNELKTLPQIVSGFSQECTRRASDYWSLVSQSVVIADSLEAAELVKLANNTFRDISFAFANELALVADKFNVNAFNLVRSANDGYPRNKLPYPSPGVGGYCLTKDPLLFSSLSGTRRQDAYLGIASRAVNQLASEYPLDLLRRFCSHNKISIEETKVLLIGMAFKGIPETTDLRGSTSVEIFDKLVDVVGSISIWDAVVPNVNLAKITTNIASDLQRAVAASNVVLILNNNPKNISWDIKTLDDNKKRLIFDGWNLLRPQLVSSFPYQTYSTMGYINLE